MTTELTPELEQEMREAVARKSARSRLSSAIRDYSLACMALRDNPMGTRGVSARLEKASAAVEQDIGAYVIACGGNTDGPAALTPERVSAYLAGLDDVAFLEVLAAGGERTSVACKRVTEQLRESEAELDRLRAENAELARDKDLLIRQLENRTP
ncbi:MAG TPA: hypothetical protein VFZ21_30830 [Gemmatimonadaceae bacterium]|nr:hypothetical protein [Gemmatimonadaceae bacterium]